MIPVIIESPYSGEIHRNEVYLLRCIRHSILLGEAPLASHQMYTTALAENVPDEREAGIRAGYAWWDSAKLICFYVDYGRSPGMLRAHKRCMEYGYPIVHRFIGKNL